MDQGAHAGDETTRETTIWVGRVARFTVSVPELGQPDVALALLTSDGRTVELEFLGVMALQVHDFMTGWPMTLQITDRSRDGWERADFEVSDAEEGTLRFRCAEVRSSMTG